MRKVWAGLVIGLVLAMPAHAQIVSGAGCENAPGWLFKEIKLSLMEEGRIKQYKTVKAADLAPPGVVLEFNKASSAYTVSRIWIQCTFVSATDPDVDESEVGTKIHWRTNRANVSAGAEAKIGLGFKLLAPGIFRAWWGVEPGSTPPAAAGA